MKSVTLISVFLLSISFVFPQDYNQKNRHGQKTGEWVEYFPDGYKKQIIHYTPLEFRLDTFLIPDTTLIYYDTIIAPNPEYVKMDHGFVSSASFEDELPSRIDWIERFEYDSSWKLQRVVKTYSTGTSIFLYGDQKQIGIVDQTFRIEGIVGNTYQISVPIRNFSNEKATLGFENVHSNMKVSDTYLVPGDTEYNVNLSIVPDPNHHVYHMGLVGEGFRIELIISTEAYHLRTSDFRSSGPIIIANRNLVIKRAGSEALLTVQSLTNGKIIKQIPLSHELGQIDLAELKPGEYIFVFTDFSDNSKIVKRIELQ